MSEGKDKRVYCTNMQEDDPIIQNFKKEYLQHKQEAEKGKPEDIFVNFDVSYPDGTCETHTCGSEGYVFGHNDGSSNNCKFEPEQMNGYSNDKHINNQQFSQQYDSQWGDSEDDWGDSSCHCSEVHGGKVEGTIAVVSTMAAKNGTRLKGVKINLYRINGISPRLVASDMTDSDGKVIFTKVPQGSYRVIELIDKRYFEKPKYLDWNEVTINEDTKEICIYAINRIKNQRQCRR